MAQISGAKGDSLVSKQGRKLGRREHRILVQQEQPFDICLDRFR
jgi:hypothetical protein